MDLTPDYLTSEILNYKESKISQFIREDCNFLDWTLHNFTLLFQNFENSRLETKVFPEQSSECKWKIILIAPSGRIGIGEENAVMSFILTSKQGSDPFILGKFSICITNTSNQSIYVLDEMSHECTYDSRLQNIWGYPKFLIPPFAKFFHNINYDDFRIDLKIAAIYKAEKASWSVSSAKKFKIDFSDVLNLSSISDVVIDVDGIQFKAHRWILEAKSPIFEAMFSNSQYVECSTGRIVITDFDATTVHCLLQYMYRGWVDFPDTIDSMIKLMQAADKYFLDNLKFQCLAHISSKLNLVNVCDVLLKADDFDIADLKDSVMEYICVNIKQFTDVNKYRLILKEKPLLLAEILVHFANMP